MSPTNDPFATPDIAQAHLAFAKCYFSPSKMVIIHIAQAEENHPST